MANMATGKRKGVFVGCGKPHTSVHVIPTDKIRNMWLNIFDEKVPSTFGELLGKHLTVTKSNHFYTPDCFGNLGQY